MLKTAKNMMRRMVKEAEKQHPEWKKAKKSKGQEQTGPTGVPDGGQPQ